MGTAGDLINSSLRLIGVIASGETPSADETADGLVALNNMLASWKTEQLTVFSTINRTHALTATIGSYTMGSGGTINVARPVRIDQAGIIQSNGLRTELELFTNEKWASIPEKGVNAVQPLGLYNDNGYPLLTLYLWPRPSGTPTLDMWVWQALDSFTLAADTFNMPPGYERAVRYNLAVDLAPEYGRPVPEAVAAIAQQSKADIVTNNASVQAGVQQTDLPQLGAR